MITPPSANPHVVAAIAEEEIRKAQSAALIRHSDTKTDPLFTCLSVVEAPPWGNSRSCEYISSQEIQARFGHYQGVEPKIEVTTTAQVSQVQGMNARAIVLDPSDIIINIDDELRSTQFSKDRTIEAMFPGIFEEMNRILGG